MQDTLEAIKENGLSIRQIPLEVVSGYAASDRRPPKNQETKWEKLKSYSNVAQEKFDNLCERNLWVKPYFKLENGQVWRQYVITRRIPEYAGYWLCRKCTTTDSRIKWNYKTDNLAKTLEESVAKYLTK